MHQTGNGALNETDIAMLNTGIYSVTPPSSKHGKHVLSYASTRRVEYEGMSTQEMIETESRIYFYFQQVVIDLMPLEQLDFYVLGSLDLAGFRRAFKAVPMLSCRFK